MSSSSSHSRGSHCTEQLFLLLSPEFLRYISKACINSGRSDASDPEQSDLTLVIVGNWNNSKYGKQLKAKYLNADNIYLIDPIYNPEKLNFLRCHCSIYIHGHSAGGTNPSLVEAMSLGLAIVAFDVIYNRETTRNNACYFKGAAELIMTVNLLLVDDERRNALGKSMYNLATNYYRWENIANQYAVLLNQIDGKK